MRALVAVGIASLLLYFSWWITSGRIQSPWFAFALMLAGVYSSIQILGSWILYLRARRHPKTLPTPTDLTVDVFITACKESPALVRRTLVAACVMRGEHRTWLLDDGADPALEQLAASIGIGYLTRPNRRDDKAGNVNAALARTSGALIALFDADHAPTPDFLEQTLGYFADARMGFVQTMPTFCNSQESWVARAAAETTLDFYNAISLGMEQIGSTTMMGSNSLIRREALESIGGYKPGLAEDLATSLELHAGGWHSAYVAEPLAPGLAPPDLTAWFTQQLKWARGVFEVMLTTFPRAYPRLNWNQRLAYGVRMSYYWIGPVIAAHLLLAAAVLFSGSHYAQWSFKEYVVSLFPLVLLVLSIRQMALRHWRHPSIVAGLLWRAVVLVYATWPIYTLAWLMAVARVPLGYRLTPKNAARRMNPVWLLPQASMVALFLVALVFSILVRGTRPSLLLIIFVACQVIPQLILLLEWIRSSAPAAVARQIPGLPAPDSPGTPVGVTGLKCD